MATVQCVGPGNVLLFKDILKNSSLTRKIIVDKEEKNKHVHVSMKNFDGLKTSIVFQAFLTILIFNAYQVFLFWHIKYRNCFCFFFII